ncbi:hypothetical protein LDENG_00076790 [Lucifuga dentata]|nr:hypothetical protein LDENG_00076790 [Lucifuga dentata]
MTHFMTAQLQIHARLCVTKQQAKCAQLQLSCNVCSESHRTQVWLCFLILSFLSTSACAASVAVVSELQICLDRMKHTIEKSDALLYAPSSDDIKINCRIMSLKCYMLELEVIFIEEDIEDKEIQCILGFSYRLPPEDSFVDCPPCEAYALKNTTIFLGRLKSLLHQLVEW